MAIPAASMTFGMPNGSTASLETDERQADDAIADGFREGYLAPLITVTHAPASEQINALELPLMALSLRDLPGVLTARPVGLSADGAVALVAVIPQHGPDDPSTTDLVHDLRHHGASVIDIEGASFGVTGLTAVNVDISNKLAHVLPVYIAMILVLLLIVLLLVFRSVLIPITATAVFQAPSSPHQAPPSVKKELPPSPGSPNLGVSCRW